MPEIALTPVALLTPDQTRHFLGFCFSRQMRERSLEGIIRACMGTVFSAAKSQQCCEQGENAFMEVSPELPGCRGSGWGACRPAPLEVTVGFAAWC